MTETERHQTLLAVITSLLLIILGQTPLIRPMQKVGQELLAPFAYFFTKLL